MGGNDGNKVSIHTEYHGIELDARTEEAGRRTTRRPVSKYNIHFRLRLLRSELNAHFLRSAWRFTVRSGALAGFLILLINIITLIIIYSRYKVEDSVATIFEGSCTTASQVSIVSHVIVNILSTILLAYSNYAMQCLGSPTRTEIDRAHSKKRWLSIGTPTIRNLFFISRIKATLWIVLAISSFPLHVLWNSVVFRAETTNDYLVIAATQDFLHGANWSLPLESSQYSDGSASSRISDSSAEAVIDHLQQVATNKTADTYIEFLDLPACVNAYGQDRLQGRRHLILVVDPFEKSQNPYGSVLDVYFTPFTEDRQVQFQWMCGDQADPDDRSARYTANPWQCPVDLRRNVSSPDFEWTPGLPYDSHGMAWTWAKTPVRHCYGERVEGHCKITVVPLFLIIISVCNVLKIVAMTLSLRITRKEPPLVTTGDAIQSFLERPDFFTRGRCLAAKHDYDKKFGFGISSIWNPRSSKKADIWHGDQRPFGRAIHSAQWVVFMICMCAAIIFTGVTYATTTQSYYSILSLGLGEPHPAFMAPGPAQAGAKYSQISSTLDANIPQIVVSYLYLAFGNILTSMLAMEEYCNYVAGKERPAKGLRVTSPQQGSAQRSTFFLSVPYRWAVPAIICITTIHWLVSQMVFPARIEVYDVLGNVDLKHSVTSVFYSTLAMLLAVSLASALVIGLACMGMFMKFPTGIPLAGNCSASIAAACQPVPGEDTFPEELARQRLKWGAVSFDHNNEVGHATFDAGNPKKILPSECYT